MRTTDSFDAHPTDSFDAHPTDSFDALPSCNPPHSRIDQRARTDPRRHSRNAAQGPSRRRSRGNAATKPDPGDGARNPGIRSSAAGPVAGGARPPARTRAPRPRAAEGARSEGVPRPGQDLVRAAAGQDGARGRGAAVHRRGGARSQHARRLADRPAARRAGHAVQEGRRLSRLRQTHPARCPSSSTTRSSG